MPIIVIHNAETGEVIEREMTKSELNQLEKDKITNAEIEAFKEAEANKKLALLTKLGITEDEVKLLLS